MGIDERVLSEHKGGGKVQKSAFKGTNGPGKHPKITSLMDVLKQENSETLEFPRLLGVHNCGSGMAGRSNPEDK